MLIVRSIQDAWELIRAKRSRREPLRFLARGVAEAIYHPRDAPGWRRLLASMRESRDFGQATERVLALGEALRRRHACELPVPRKAMQNSDRSLTLWWEGAMVRVFQRGEPVVLLGGADGLKQRGFTRELLALLAFHARVQAAS